MCGLCGLFGVAVHWTDVAAAPDAFSGRKEQTIRQERHARIVLANRVLKHYRLKLSDVAGRSYLLTSATGSRRSCRISWPCGPKRKSCSGGPAIRWTRG